VSTEFTVVRNAPGLFTNNVSGQAYAIATHSDGTPVTPGSPVADGETVVVYGTGFGPLVTPAMEGMVIQPAAEFQLADPIDAQLGSNLLISAYAGAAGPRPGMNAVQVQVSTSGASSTFKVRVNVQESNAVILPIGQ
jgi:uncharacterized protein (TIGR03437 family)